MPGCLDKESKFGRNEFLRLGSRDILKFFRVDQVRNAWEGKNMEKKKRIKRHAAGLCAGLGILFAASVPMTAFADTVYVNASKLITGISRPLYPERFSEHCPAGQNFPE